MRRFAAVKVSDETRARDRLDHTTDASVHVGAGSGLRNRVTSRLGPPSFAQVGRTGLIASPPCPGDLLTQVLVTGGTGFLGGWCVAELLNRAHSVRTTVRDPAAGTPCGRRSRPPGSSRATG